MECKGGPSRALVTIGLAIACGFIGSVVGGFTLDLFLQGGPPDLTVGVLRATAVGGGIGWFVGTVIGWLLTSVAIPPSRAQTWGLRGAAVVMVLLGLAVVRGVLAANFGPSIDEVRPNDPELLPLAAIIRLDTALAAVTFLVVAQRRVLRWTVAAAGGTRESSPQCESADEAERAFTQAGGRTVVNGLAKAGVVFGCIVVVAALRFVLVQ